MTNLVIEPLLRQDGIYRARVVEYLPNGKMHKWQAEAEVIYLTLELETLEEVLEEARLWIQRTYPDRTYRIEEKVEKLCWNRTMEIGNPGRVRLRRGQTVVVKTYPNPFKVSRNGRRPGS
jgi:hypothetical protein